MFLSSFTASKFWIRPPTGFSRSASSSGIIKAGRVANSERPVQLASIQTLARRVSDGRLEYPKADVVVVDECHHALARTWRAALDANPDARRYGFTATPCRGDGRGLGDLFDELIIGPQVPELQSAGHLTPVKYFAPAKIDLRGVRNPARRLCGRGIGRADEPCPLDRRYYHAMASPGRTPAYNRVRRGRRAQCFHSRSIHFEYGM